MPRSINDVDAVIVPLDGGVLGQNGNAALTFLVVGVHDALGAFIAAAQGAGLLQQLVDQSGFAVVNVGDNGNISEVLDHA